MNWFTQEQILTKLIECWKELKKAKEDSARRNMKCMDLPPRSWARGGKNTSIQAKACTMAQYRDKKETEFNDLINAYLHA